MRADDMYRTAKSVIGEERFNTVRNLLGPVYRTVAYDLIQPVQNRVRFWRQIRDVPSYDLGDKDVLVVVIDSLRNDHVSRSGYERETTPFLDSIGTYYPNCVTAAPWTYSSVPSILTGLYPHNHGAVYESELRDQGMRNPPATVRDDIHTLPELLAKSDYETYFSSAIVTAELPIRGRFKHADVYHNAPANEMIDHLLDWWETTAGKRFGYIQLGDLHEPLSRPTEQPFGDVPDIPNIEEWDYTKTTDPQDQFETYSRERIRFYDNVLRYVDSQISRLFSELDQCDDLDDTLIVITADHGEEFWERVEFEREHFYDPRDIYGTGHGHALIPEVLFVPLIIINGTVTKTSDWVSLIDITPTVLNELGFPDEELVSYDGKPLQDPESNRVVLSEEIAYGYDQQAVIHDGHLLINSLHESTTVVLDLESDRIIDDSAIKTDLLSHLTDRKRTGHHMEIDQATRDQLKELGYR